MLGPYLYQDRVFVEAVSISDAYRDFYEFTHQLDKANLWNDDKWLLLWFLFCQYCVHWEFFIVTLALIARKKNKNHAIMLQKEC